MLESTLRLQESRSQGRAHVMVWMVALYFLMAPIEDFLSGQLDNTLRFFSIALAIAFLYEQWLSPRHSISVQSYRFVIPFALVFLANASLLWSVNQEATIARNVAYTTLPLVFLVITSRDYSREDRLLIEGSVLSSAFIVFALVKLFPSQRTSDLGRLTLSEANDPNNLAAIMMLPLAISIAWVSSHKGLKVWLALAALGGSIWIILTTGSRGGALAMGAALVLGGFHFSARRAPLRWVRLLLLVGLAVVLGYGLIPTTSFDRILGVDQYTRDLHQYGSRSDIWRVVSQNILPTLNPWGLGSGCAPGALASHYGHAKGVHNTYLNLVVEFGILGLPLLAVLLWKAFQSARHRRDLGVLIALTGLSIVIFFLDSYAKKFFWNVLAYGCMFLDPGPDLSTDGPGA